MESVETDLRERLRDHPEEHALRLHAAMHALRRGAYREAQQDVMRACACQLPASALLADRLEALRAFHLHAQMQSLARQCPPEPDVGEPMLRRCAAALQSSGLSAEALEFAEAAQRSEPGSAAAGVQLALLCIECGQLERAQRLLSGICDRSPTIPIAHWALARLEGEHAPASRIARLQRLLSEHATDAHATAFLGFALHHLLEARQHSERAFAALQQACAAKRSTLQFDEAAQQALTAALRDEPVEHSPMRSANDGQPLPIFIVGMHRSGTSLLERILEGHPQVVAGGEHFRLTAQARFAADRSCPEVLSVELLKALRGVDARALGDAYLDANRWLSSGHSHFTDKLPQNYLLIGLIARALPQARVLHLVRDPLDTCASNLRELFGGANAAYSYHPDELARTFARYRSTMAHWHSVLPGFVLDVSYADLVRDPESTIRQVFAFCGLDFRAEALDIRKRNSPARSASALQVRNSIHARSVGRGGASPMLREVMTRALRAAGVEL